MNKISKLAVSVLLVFSLLAHFQASPTVAKAAGGDVVKEKTAFSTNYDNETTADKYVPTTSPDSDNLRGKVAYFENASSSNYQASVKNTNRIVASFDLYATSSADKINVRFRYNPGTGHTRTSIGSVAFTGKLKVNTWYNIIVDIDYAGSQKATITAVDSGGQEISVANKSIELTPGSYTVSYLELVVTGSLYLDNYVIKEYIPWPQIDNITGSDGEPNPIYTNNKLILNMTQSMKTVNKSDITLVNNISSAIVSLESVALNDKQILITTSEPLKSSTSYTLTLSGNALMTYNSLPLEDAQSVSFTTSSRPLDITGVDFVPSDGNMVIYEINLTNTTGENQNIIVIASSFDEYGRLTQSVFQPVIVGYEAPIAKPQGILTVPENGSVKVFAIENFASLKNLNNIIYTYSLN